MLMICIDRCFGEGMATKNEFISWMIQMEVLETNSVLGPYNGNTRNDNEARLI